MYGVYVCMFVCLSLYGSVCILVNNSCSSFKFSLIPFNPESWSTRVTFRTIMVRIFTHGAKTTQDWRDGEEA